MTLATMTRAEREQRIAELRAAYDAFRGRGLALDMTRGKPCPEQLDLSLGLLDCLGRDYQAADGTDCRNYGVLEGLPEARALFAELLEVEPAEVIVGGNSSLALMHDTIVQYLLKGTPDAPPWRGQARGEVPLPEPRLRPPFRHLRALRHQDAADPDGTGRAGHRLGRAAGARRRATSRASGACRATAIPGGVVCSPRVVERLAPMETAANDFRIFWDNAYAVHHLVDDPPPLANILTACRAAGNPDRPVIFTSTSKISFAGAGVGVLAASPTNIRHLLAGLSIQTIGHDKLNQLRHVRFFRTPPASPRTCGSTRRSSRRSSTPSPPSSPSAWAARASPPGASRRAATSSASTPPTAARRGSCSWPTRRA